MVASFPSNADSAQLATDGYSEVILLAESSTEITVDYLILAGGGGGGGVIDGGGGAGGYRTSWGTGADGSGGNSGGLSALETALSLSNGTSYSITVGQGGEGGVGYNSTTNHRGHKGRSTSISGTGITTVTSDGGGGGIGFTSAGGPDEDGGSGGGGAASQAGGSGTSGQGFDGGASSADVGAGGGGAGATGVNATVISSAGDGGDGLASTITGVSITRAGGGGGGIRQTSGSDNGIGGAGGGGDGGVFGANAYPSLPYGTVTTTSATHGRAQYGGGGGGAGYNSTGSSAITGGNGGSGIAIFRIPSTVTYSSSQLASDVSSLSNCTASYLNTQVYTDDTNFDDVILLMDGTSINEDLSPQNQTITEQNTSTALSSETDPFGNTQNVLDFSRTDATGSGLKITDAPMGLGNNPFTVEMFIKLDVTGVVHTILSDRDSTNTTIASFRVNALNTLQFFKDNSGGGSFTGSTTMTTGTWYHVALTYDGSTVRMFLDGALEGSSNQTLTFNSSRSPRLGYDPQFPETTYQFDGRMAQVRITKGVARYTSAFTAPTSAFPNGKTSTGGDHVISFTVATEDAYDGGATTNDGTITWAPTVVAPPPSTTWTVPDGVDSLSIVAIGPGGGSGGSNGTNAGGGGGGGGLAWINNVVVSEGSTITMVGGTGGAGADSGNASGDSGTGVTVSINVLGAEADYSSVDLNPYNDIIISSDSASGILTVRSGKGTDSDVLSSFGKLESYDGGSLQTKFDIYNNTKNSFDLNFNVQPYVEYDSSVLPLSYPSWSGGAPGGMNDSDAYPNLYVDSNLYENEDTVLGTIDTIDVGSGRLTLFGVFTNDVGTALQATISNSPYLDSNGNSNVGATDPNDVRGYGPTGEAESIQIIVRSRAGDTISSV